MRPFLAITRQRFPPALMVAVWFCIVLWVVDVLVSVFFLLGKPQLAGTSFYWWLLDFAVTTGLGAMVFLLWKLWSAKVRTQDFSIRNAVHAERARIAHELHDGLGFHLVNTLFHAEDNPQELTHLRRGLEQALIDLHSVIDCIESEHPGLLDLMADLRYRIQPALDRQGIAMRWHLSLDAVLAELPNPYAKHLAKITQEALSNTLQHASATEVEVSLAPSEDGTSLVLQVLDDGCGVPEFSEGNYGMGLAGIHRRAQLIGADLRFSKGLHGKGMGICVYVPLMASTTAAPQ